LAVVAADAGIAVGEGDLLGVADDPDVDLVGATFGAVPNVEAVGEEGVILGINEDEDEDGSTALVEVMALGIFTLASGDGLDLAAEVILPCIG
jgi:hypothetical protein